MAAGLNGDDLGPYLDTVPDIPGIRPVTRVPDAILRRADFGLYRRQAAPGAPIGQPHPQVVVSLVRPGGGLRWVLGTPGGVAAGRRGGARAALPAGKIVKQYAFETLPGSKVTEALVAIDRRLTPDAAYADPAHGANGLRRWANDRLIPFPDPSQAAGKRVLLFVHGTFSNSEALLQGGLGTIPDGAKLLADVERAYDLVLAYDHPTLSVGPSLNAFDLAALLRPAPAGIDIVCHSRGGLVARWFSEAFCDPVTSIRVVFVGSPLAGTSLAAAPRLRSTLDLLTNIADLVRLGLGPVAWVGGPLFAGITGLLRVVTAVTGTLATAPLLDAAIALVPGLSAQSYQGNNEEIRRLRANTGNADFATGRLRYFGIQSNFEPKDPKWNFLQYFSKPLQRLADLGADLVFDDENDLVVDTRCMREVADQKLIELGHDFGTSAEVHHLNYFVQPRTVAAIRKAFAIP